MPLWGVLAVIGVLLLGSLIVNSLANRGADVPYANEGYTPPPVERPTDIPVPTTYEELDAFLYDNPVNQQQVATPVRCDTTQIDPRSATNGELEEHFDTQMGCAMAVWVGAVEGAGWELYRPSVTIYEGSIETPCGEVPEYNAVYCAANQQLYYSKQLPEQPAIAAEAANPTAMDLVMAHEFGHLVQGRTGQLAAGMILQQEREEDDQLLLNRMLETQADCYSGLYLASTAISTPYTQDDFDNFLLLAERLGSDNLSGDPDILTTHPRGEARRYWVQTGLSTNEVGKCSTYNVSDERLTS